MKPSASVGLPSIEVLKLEVQKIEILAVDLLSVEMLTSAASLRGWKYALRYEDEAIVFMLERYHSIVENRGGAFHCGTILVKWLHRLPSVSF